MQFGSFNDVMLGYELELKIKQWKRMFAKNSAIRKQRIKKVGVRHVA